MSNLHYQNTKRIVAALKSLQCPICGKSPIVEITNADTFKIHGTCHEELDKLIAQTKNAFLAPRFRHSDIEPGSESPLG